ncbi:unnamed protein product [Rotaria sordida]|uniref:Rab-GAP TBC domain-containing protein n=1 Tax=Rotaria sordida TaxID=392033 RepID=A0A814QY57_9BILA|nr:unnamed protein product [Rotaria sordida]
MLFIDFYLIITILLPLTIHSVDQNDDHYQDIYFEVVEPSDINYTFRCRPSKQLSTNFNQFYENIYLIPAKPLRGCSRLQNDFELNRNIALIERGDCSFVTKIEFAQQSGALGVMIMDNDSTAHAYFVQMIDDMTKRKVLIPAMFLQYKDGHLNSKSECILSDKLALDSFKVLKHTTLRPQRLPPPPPPSQSQLSTQPIDQTTIPSEFETSPSSTQTSIKSIDNMNTMELSLLSEFKYLFDNFNYELIREEILNRKMIQCNFTTILWRIFLHCLPRDSNQWNDVLDTSRNNYEKLVNQYKTDPYKMNNNNNQDTENLNHPLSRDENSLWSQYFSDEELKATITTDVRRTCPDISFFRNPRMIDLQLRILFTHSRHLRKTTPYRQGMHEILGIVVYAIHLESLKVNEYQESNELMKKLYDLQYLEHDAYAIFEKIIAHLRQFYSLSTNNSSTYKVNVRNGTKQIPFQRLNDVHIPPNDTVTRMNSIFERLRHYDHLLHCKLEELNIEPTVYGIRWLRLLFGREIPFESIPSLWTVIFCYDEHFGFVDYFFIALLIQVGQIIGNQEEIGHCSYLQSLMKQNVITDAEPVIRKALTLTGRQLPPLPEQPIILSIGKKDENRPNQIENDRENTVRAKELQRIPIVPGPKPRLNRPNITDIQQLTTFSQANHTMDSLKRSSSSNSPLTSSSQIAKSIPSNISVHSELDLWSGKTTRQRYDDNVRLQNCCAQYMNKFIERLQKQICDLEAPNEDELHIQLSGLKQIANILEGKLTFDSESLQALLDYGCKEKKIETNNSDTSELS